MGADRLASVRAAAARRAHPLAALGLAGALLIGAAASGGGCAVGRTARATAGVPSLPRGALAVPLVRQATRYSCGAAALLAVLYYWRVYDGNESELWPALHTTERDGTEPAPMVALARAHGLTADYRTDVTVDELRAALAAGQTVIVDLQAWQEQPRPWASDWDDGHYVVLVALDAHALYAMDPSVGAGYARLPLEQLAARWHDVEAVDHQERQRQHLAIFVSGAAHLSAVPAPLTEMR